jgi:hypothetical protein
MAFYILITGETLMNLTDSKYKEQNIMQPNANNYTK